MLERRATQLNAEIERIESMSDSGAARTWLRHVEWRDWTGQFGDKNGWQTVRPVIVDRMP